MATATYVGTAGAVGGGATLLVDEDGNYLVDEDGKYLEIDQFVDLVTVSVQRGSYIGSMQAVAASQSIFTAISVQQQWRFLDAGAIARPSSAITCKAAPVALSAAIAAPVSGITCKSVPAVTGKAVLSSFSTLLVVTGRNAAMAATAAPVSTYTRAARIVGTACGVAGPAAAAVVQRVVLVGNASAVASPVGFVTVQDLAAAELLAVAAPCSAIAVHCQPDAGVYGVAGPYNTEYEWYYQPVIRNEVGTAGAVAAPAATDVVCTVQLAGSAAATGAPEAVIAVSATPETGVATIAAPCSTVTLLCNPLTQAEAVATPGFEIVVQCLPLALMVSVARPQSTVQLYYKPQPTDLLKICYSVTANRKHLLADNYTTTVRRRY